MRHRILAILIVVIGCYPFNACDTPRGTPYGEPIVGNSTTAEDIAGGNAHVCALLSNGQVKCFGDNSRGQLGLTVATNASGKQYDVSGAQFSKISTGASYSCGLLKGGATDGIPVCFGESGSWLKVPAIKMKDIAAGDQFTCFIKDDQTLGCVGDKIKIFKKNEPLPVTIEAKDLPNKYGVDPSTQEENQDFSKNKFASVKVGNMNVCAIGADNNVVYCMGANAHNQANSTLIKALDYGLRADTTLFLIDENNKLNQIGTSENFAPATNLKNPEQLKYRKVFTGLSKEPAFLTGLGNQYDDNTNLPENTLIIAGYNTIVREKVLGYAATAEDRISFCLLKDNKKISCEAYLQDGAQNPHSLIVKNLPKELAY